jgi:hypothetical protein
MIVFAVFRHRNDYDAHADLEAIYADEKTALASAACITQGLRPQDMIRCGVPALLTEQPGARSILIWKCLDQHDEGWTIEAWKVHGA